MLEIRKKFLLSFMAVLFIGGAPHVPRAAEKRPIIFVPAIMGSKLCNSKGELIWGDLGSYLPNRLAQLRLPIDGSPPPFEIRPCGLIENITVIPLFYTQHVYDDLRNSLESIVRRKRTSGCETIPTDIENSYIEFSYDWRLSNFETARELSKCIRKFPEGTKFDIVAHSMGGLIARIAIQTLGQRARVANLITLGTPHLGSASVFKRLSEGIEEDILRAFSTDILTFREIILSFPSTYQLLPSYFDCCTFVLPGGGSTSFNVFDPESWKKIKWLPPSITRNDKFLRAQLQTARHLSQLMREPIFDVADKQAFYVANGLVETWSKVSFSSEDGRILNYTSAPGDGTVIQFSATGGEPRRILPSGRQHEMMFAGDGVDNVLLTVSGGREFTSMVKSILQVRELNGVTVNIDRIGTRLNKTVFKVGEEVEIEATLRSASRLSDAVLGSVIEATLMDSSNKIEMQNLYIMSRNYSKVNQDWIGSIKFKTEPLRNAGVMQIVTSFGGINILKDVIVAIGQEQK